MTLAMLEMDDKPPSVSIHQNKLEKGRKLALITGHEWLVDVQGWYYKPSQN